MDVRVIEVTDFKTEVGIDLWDNLKGNIGKISLQVMRGSPFVLANRYTSSLAHVISISGLSDQMTAPPRMAQSQRRTSTMTSFRPSSTWRLTRASCRTGTSWRWRRSRFSSSTSSKRAVISARGTQANSRISGAETITVRSPWCTEMGERVGPRLRELASRGRREPGGRIHAT